MTTTPQPYNSVRTGVQADRGHRAAAHAHHLHGKHTLCTNTAPETANMGRKAVETGGENDTYKCGARFWISLYVITRICTYNVRMDPPNSDGIWAALLSKRIAPLFFQNKLCSVSSVQCAVNGDFGDAVPGGPPVVSGRQRRGHGRAVFRNGDVSDDVFQV